jgi:signal peptidase I
MLEDRHPGGGVCSDFCRYACDKRPVTVPEGNYFFLGDNRGNSADSRFIGMVPRLERIGAPIQ